MTFTVVGYDPRGDDKHGLALATIRDGRTVSLCTQTLKTVEKGMDRLLRVTTSKGLVSSETEQSKWTWRVEGSPALV